MAKKDNYQLIDSGNGRKLEQFGHFLLSRPSSQAVWQPSLSPQEWKKADATFLREGDTKWNFQNPKANTSWDVLVSDIRFKISLTDFGHLGIFPEQRPFWKWIQEVISHEKTQRSEPIQVLNLFAYSGGSTLAAAKAGAHVCHLDASKGMVDWARENAALNNLSDAPIRWIVDDVRKFLTREIKRERYYDAIILDPPSFGRGRKGEIFKIEEHLPEIMKLCHELLSKNPLFLLLSCHSPGWTPIVLSNVLQQSMQGLKGEIDAGEMTLTGTQDVFPLPSGAYSRWRLSNA